MVYLLRHGQTDWNKLKLIQSQADIPLNDTGIKQAEEAKSKLNNTDFKHVYSSNLSRAKETASIISGKNPVCDVRLTEVSSGKFEGMHIDKVKEIKMSAGYDPENYGVESPDSLYKRVDSFLTEIMSEILNDDILIVSHAGTCKAIIKWFEQLGCKSGMKSELPGNCEIMTFEVQKESGK